MKKKCHISRDPFCLGKDTYDNMDIEFLEAYKIYIEFTQPSLATVKNDVIKKMLYPEYHEVLRQLDLRKNKTGLYIFLGVTIAILLALGSLIFTIYIKLKNPDDSNEDEDLVED